MENQEFCLDGRKSRSLKLFDKKWGIFPPINKEKIVIYIDFLYNEVNYSRLVAIV